MRIEGEPKRREVCLCGSSDTNMTVGNRICSTCGYDNSKELLEKVIVKKDLVIQFKWPFIYIEEEIIKF